MSRAKVLIVMPALVQRSTSAIVFSRVSRTGGQEKNGSPLSSQVGRRLAVGDDHDLALAALVAHQVAAERQGVLEVRAVVVVDGERRECPRS